MEAKNISKYPNSKARVYIDAANIILTARDVNLNLDLNRLFVLLKDKYRTDHIVFFIGDVKYLNEIESVLNESNIEVVIKQTIKEGGKIKANCDVEITNRITVDVERNLVDRVILLTGDGDFAALLDYCLGMEKIVRAVGVNRKFTSYFLRKRQYLEMIFLDEIVELPSTQMEELLDKFSK